jgi:hypothetical protein
MIYQALYRYGNPKHSNSVAIKLESVYFEAEDPSQVSFEEVQKYLEALWREDAIGKDDEASPQLIFLNKISND